MARDRRPPPRRPGPRRRSGGCLQILIGIVCGVLVFLVAVAWLLMYGLDDPPPTGAAAAGEAAGVVLVEVPAAAHVGR